MGSTNERMRYCVTPFLIGWAHTQNDPNLSTKRREHHEEKLHNKVQSTQY